MGAERYASYGPCFCGARAGEPCLVVGGYGAKRTKRVGKPTTHIHITRKKVAAMAVTKKDFIAVAEALSDMGSDPAVDKPTLFAVRLTLCDVFEAANPRFNAALFMSASAPSQSVQSLKEKKK